MKFALVNNERCEATPKAKGICPCCGNVVIAKCGEKKAHHWAHESKKNCQNNRWETEGEWHQNWKNKFPKNWQEKIIIINGEKNIADIQNEQGLVVEFQHSHIKPEEQRARETSYKNMIWVVDGMRLKNDFPRFQKHIESNTKLFMNGFPLHTVSFLEEVFSKNWIHCSVPVFFDFRKEPNDEEIPLYCLLPQTVSKESYSSYIFPIRRAEFISLITTNQWQKFYEDLLNGIFRISKEYEKLRQRQAEISAKIAFNRIMGFSSSHRNRRRF
ncbi:MAG: competence protein [Alphaproteobacteria bacterium]|nr:competence protein [Alphaproteobacteria bacterium]